MNNPTTASQKPRQIATAALVVALLCVGYNAYQNSNALPAQVAMFDESHSSEPGGWWHDAWDYDYDDDYDDYEDHYEDDWEDEPEDWNDEDWEEVEDEWDEEDEVDSDMDDWDREDGSWGGGRDSVEEMEEMSGSAPDEWEEDWDADAWADTGDFGPVRGVESSASTNASVTSNSSASTQSSEEEDKEHCCLCQYLHVEGCDGLTPKAKCTETACSDGIDNDGDGKKDYPDDPGCTSAVDHDETGKYSQKDCVWHDGKCMGWFKSGCEKWKNQEPQKSECDPMIVTKDDVRPQDIPELRGCEEITYYRDGHGQGCHTYSQRILGCLTCAGASCTNINATDIGCSTFNNLAHTRLWMQHIRRQLQPGQTLHVTAKQATSTDTCTSELHYELTITELTETPDPCHNQGDWCPNAREGAILCTDGTGSVVNERCCPGLSRNGGYWNRGAACPPRPPRQISGSCRYDYTAYSCPESATRARRRVEDCFAHNLAFCRSKGYNSFDFPACPINKTSSGWRHCTHSGTCPWTCKYVEGR